MSHFPRLSVCLPTYNGAEFIAEAVRSILTQSFTDFELMVVDDGSTDATLDIVHSFVDTRLQVRRNDERLGIPKNWNRCLALARGEYICIFHQDDVMLPGNLERKIQLMTAYPDLSFVHSAVELVIEKSAPSGLENWVENATEDFVIDGLGYFRRLLFAGNLLCAPTLILRRALCATIGGFDEELGFTPDYEMWLKACVEGRVGFLSQPLVRYRWHSGNASHAFHSTWGVDEMLIARRRAIEYFTQRTARPAEAEVLSAAVEALATSDRRTVQQYQHNTELRAYIKELEALRDKLWADVQQVGRSWEQQKVHIENQQAYIQQLEELRDKLWADVQRMGRKWEEQQASVEKQRRYIVELKQERDMWKARYDILKARYDRVLFQRLRRLAESVWRNAH